jgi:dienelactone hydrolase
LEAVLIRPAGDKRYPLALMTHGSPGDVAAQHKATPNTYYPQAMELARRGFAALAFMRRDYGNSGGAFAESLGSCNNPGYLRAAVAATEDMNAAIAAMKARRDITLEGMIAVGQSSGGLSTIALAAKPPAGMVAAINFAGGLKRDRVLSCNPNQLTDAFRSFGKTSRIPTLWIYSENDQLFPPETASALHQAFVSAGGRAEFISAPKLGNDGHGFFALAIPQWTVMLDRFLASIGIERPLLPPPESAPLTAPQQLNSSGQAGFRAYLAAGPHRAFAVTPRGGWGWHWGFRNVEDARKAALDACKLPTCAIYSVDDKVEEITTQPGPAKSPTPAAPASSAEARPARPSP